MAIPFLNNINLSDNELQNAKLHVTGTAPTVATGQIYYDSSLNVARYYDNDGWVRITDTSLTSGTFVSATLSGTSAEKSYAVELSATGTPSTSTFLRGDNTWATVVQENDFLTGLSFNTSDGVLTATVSNQDDVTVDLDGRYLEGNETITLTGDVEGSGTTSIITTITDGAVEFDMIDDAVIITEAEGVGNNDNDTTIPTTAAVKDYVDSSVAGGLVYQGGYNASTNTPNLDTPPTGTIKQGFTYTVTVDGTFFTEQVRVGDVLIAEVNGPTTLADWTTVQNNIDLADASTVGIGNVAAGVDNLDGIHVSYNSYGTAFVGLDIEGLPIDNLSEISESFEIPLYNSVDDINRKSSIKDLVELVNSTTSKAYTINDTATITYPFTLTTATKNDVIIQLVDFVTNETVYADVDRISTTQATITFASTPTNAVRVLVHKIG